MEHDGAAAALGVAVGLLSIVVVWGAMLALIYAAFAVLDRIGG